MDGDGDEAVGKNRGSTAFDLPAVLARLDDCNPDEQRAAVRTISAHVDERPDACLPTVPKLRALLERPSLDCHDEIATCLATLADHSPVDVAPSVDEIVAFVADEPGHEATPDLVRCLETVATDCPTALVDHVDGIDAALESDDPDARAMAAAVLARLGAGTDASLEPARPRLLEALEDENARVRANACLAIGYGKIADARERLTTLATDDPDPTVRERAARASDCLS